MQTEGLLKQSQQLAAELQTQQRELQQQQLVEREPLPSALVVAEVRRVDRGDFDDVLHAGHGRFGAGQRAGGSTKEH